MLTLEAVQRYDPPPPSEYDPSYAPFDPIVARALAKDRDRRYGDAAEMMDDLRRVVLPRPAERIAQLMQRIFRAQVEEEQKMLMDSDSMKLTGSGPRRTPSKAAPAHTPARPVQTTVPEAQPPEGATQMLPNAPVRKPAVTPSKAAPAASARPPPRPPPPAAPRKEGAGDTLIDMGGVISAPGSMEAAPDDEVPGGTAMLKPGQALPPPPPRRPIKSTDTMPDASEEPVQPPEGATAFLGTAPARPPAKKVPPRPAPSGGSTNIMTAEQSQVAQQEALVKLKESEKSVIRTRTRADKRDEMKAQKSNKGMWIAVGAGGLVAVGGNIGLLLFLVADDSAASPRRKKTTPAEVEQAQVAPVPDPAPEKSAPAEEQRSAANGDAPSAPAPAEKRKAPPAEKAEPAPRKVASSGKMLGTLTLNPGPNVPVVYGGHPMPKQVGAFNLPVTAESGTIEVGDDASQFKVSLDYTVAGGSMNLKVNSVPWAIASVNGPSRGRTPVADLRVEKTMTVLELKKPGTETGMTLRLLYKPN